LTKSHGILIGAYPILPKTLQPSKGALHVVFKNQNQCFMLWEKIKARLSECHGIDSLQIVDNAYCCKMTRQGAKDAETEVANLFQSAVDTAPCTCAQSVSSPGI
jgi:hypothetical protein